MGGEFLTMSALERERASVLRQVAARLITQETAGERLGLSVRQVKRLYRVWKRLGDAGLVSRQRGRVSPRRMEASLRGRIETLLKAKYPDFGPTLAAEKLCELERIDVSREAVRRIQGALGLARVRRRRAKRVHSPRERRPRFGELIQIDASPHDWFEGRGPRCARRLRGWSRHGRAAQWRGRSGRPARLISSGTIQPYYYYVIFRTGLKTF